MKVVVILADTAEAHSQELAAAIAGVDHVIVLSSRMSVTAQSASVLLPLATFAETDGTFTNLMHRVQRFRPAVVTGENHRTMGMKMSRWDKFGAPNDRWTHGARRDCRSGWSIIASIAGELGTSWSYASSHDVFADLAAHVAGFHGMSYDLLDQHQGLVLGKADKPEPAAVVYESHVMKPQ